MDVTSVAPPNDPKLGDENDACRSKGMIEDFANEKSEESAGLADDKRGV